MKSLLIYDSQFGNTEKIAKAIGSAMAGETKILRASEAKLTDLESLDLLIIGSPTQGGRPMPALKKFLSSIPAGSLAKTKVAAFDTRFSSRGQNLILLLVMKIFNFAAPKIAKTLASKGGTLVVPPEGFIVTGKEGPLKDGELERATAWPRQMPQK
jgi:flavodoxin I